MEFTDSNIISTVQKLPEALGERKLCPHCIGRLFGKVGHGMDNPQRASEIKRIVPIETVSPSDCWLCEGLFDEIEKFVELIVEKIGDFEYSTYLVGSVIDEDAQKREEMLWAETGTLSFAESIKSEINREIGKALGKKTGRIVDFKNPDIVALVDTRFDSVSLDIRSLFIYGRYRKLVRGIPQTRWMCTRCNGKGCEHCGGKGKMYETSVQEMVGDVALKLAEGADHAFHGCGREDIDARMLGNGRPFIIEVIRPGMRSIDLMELQEKINQMHKGIIEVEGLRFSNKDEVIKIKSLKAEKVYIAEIEWDGEVSQAKLKLALNRLQGCTITQRTPIRVSHRRADAERERGIIRAELREFGDKRAIIEIEAESGTYIKELINGDEGRTKPSLSELLGLRCDVKALDVLRVEG